MYMYTVNSVATYMYIQNSRGTNNVAWMSLFFHEIVASLAFS